MQYNRAKEQAGGFLLVTSLFEGQAVPHQPGKRNVPLSGGLGSAMSGRLAAIAQQDALDFEITFYEQLLRVLPDFIEVLQVQAENYRLHNRQQDGLVVDLRLVELRPQDPRVHYNLACRYALLHQSDAALRTLRRALELGYRDFRYIEQDSDWDQLRRDPRFQRLIREFRSRS